MNVAICELAVELLRKWGLVRLPAFGTSMVPVIHPGDELGVQRADLEKICPGDIVVYARRGRLIVHRVVAVGADCTRGPYLVTRGDRSPRNDLPVFSSEVLGVVVTLERDHKPLQVRARPNGAERVIRRILRSSDRATYLYLRLSTLWRGLRFKGVSCQP